MTDLIPQQLLKQKLPRFLQKCAQTFETDIRYRNDLRYLRVWMKLVTLAIHFDCILLFILILEILICIVKC